MNVQQILKAKGGHTVTATPDMSVIDTARLVTEYRIGAVPVMDDETLVGILSERDIVRILAERGLAALSEPIIKYMTTEVETCVAADKLDDILTRMTERRFRHLPVKEGQRLVGIISIGDVVKEKLSETEMEKEAMRNYITTG